MSQEYTQIGAAIGEALEHNAAMAARHHEARATEESDRHEHMVRLVEQLSPEARQRIAQRLDDRFHEITDTEEPTDV